jgi:hypothetical protein
MNRLTASCTFRLIHANSPPSHICIISSRNLSCLDSRVTLDGPDAFTLSLYACLIFSNRASVRSPLCYPAPSSFDRRSLKASLITFSKSSLFYGIDCVLSLMLSLNTLGLYGLLNGFTDASSPGIPVRCFCILSYLRLNNFASSKFFLFSIVLNSDVTPLIFSSSNLKSLSISSVIARKS